MQADYWHNLWDTNDIGFHQEDTNPYLLEFYAHLKLEENSRVFIPLCGKTLDILWLLGKGCKVVGAELNENAIKELFSYLKVEAKVQKVDSFTLYSAQDIDIFVGDIFKLTKESLGRVDAIYDRAALVALPEEKRKEYTSLLVDITMSAPQLLINFEYDQGLMQGPPFSIKDTEIKKHYSKFYDLKLLHDDKAKDFKNISAHEKVWLLK